MHLIDLQFLFNYLLNGFDCEELDEKIKKRKQLNLLDSEKLKVDQLKENRYEAQKKYITNVGKIIASIFEYNFSNKKKTN